MTAHATRNLLVVPSITPDRGAASPAGYRVGIGRVAGDRGRRHCRHFRH